AFNQGSFNALDLTGGTYLHQGWHSFHVGPAPDRSLDKTLAEAGLSIATIDLRELPQDGPVAEWFAEPNATRNIGAAYNEKSPENYFDRHVVTRSYDALLFVETTTAARDNPWVMTPPVQLLAAPANLDFEEGEPGKPPADWLAFSEYQKQFDFHIITSEHNP
ncbi:MAG: erythromycin esterase family protein, partial [Thermodesulfobacteriota bacterium]